MSIPAQKVCIRGVVGVIERDRKFLMIKRSQEVRAPGQWCFPGGAIEPGESAADAVVREVREEVGLVVEAVSKLWSWRREDGGLYLEWWLVHLVDGTLTIKTDEVEAVKWMSDADIRTHADMIPNNLPFLDHYRKMHP